MNAGDGNDTCIVDNVGDSVRETFDDATGGVDSVNASVSSSLLPGTAGNQGFGIENLTLTGAANINGTGNAKANVITGNSGANVLFGSSGSDTLNGSTGADTANYSSLGVVVSLGAFGAVAKGALGTDSLVGVETIVGSSLLGDTVDHSAAGAPATGTVTNLGTGVVTINGTAPLPLTFSVSQFENVIGSSFADTITGNASANKLTSGAGNDFLNGSSGNDTLDGGTGSDTASYSALGTVVSLGAFGTLAKGTQGTDSLVGIETIIGSSLLGDTVDHSAAGAPATGTSTDLTSGLVTINGTAPLPLTFSVSQFENVIGSGFADTITGNTAANKLSGGAGNDSLNGSSGNDTLDGGAGVDAMNGGDNNDLYIVDSSSDIVRETFNDALGGVDAVNASVSYSLAPGTAGNQGFGIENLTLTGAANINGTGNSNNNVLIGNTGANRLIGGIGTDTQTGGAGNDTFTIGEFGATNRDQITDFSAPADTFELANSLDSTLVGAISPGIKGLTFINGNVAGSTLNSLWFFKGAGLTGAVAGNLSGIYVNTTNGDIFYNDESTAGSQIIANVGVAAAGTLTNADFVYAV